MESFGSTLFVMPDSTLSMVLERYSAIVKSKGLPNKYEVLHTTILASNSIYFQS